MNLNAVIVAEADVPNANNRIYPAEVLRQAVEQFNAMEGGMIGQMEFRPDGKVSLAEASHTVHNLRFDEDSKTLFADIACLQTPYGKVLKSLIDDGIDVKFRLGGTGSGKTNDQGKTVIENYTLVTVNALAESGPR
jgi:hypothetical protein